MRLGSVSAYAIMSGRHWRVETRLTLQESEDLDNICLLIGTTRSAFLRQQIIRSIREWVERESLLRTARPDVRY
jgi:hypothetical protein